MTDWRQAAQQALETLEALSAAKNILWIQKRAEIEVKHLRAALAQPDKCEWAQEDESSDAWDTGCGRTFLINDGTPSENDMCYCCFCGKTLIGVPFEQEDNCKERSKP
jgi:hypothetical protein